MISLRSCRFSLINTISRSNSSFSSEPRDEEFRVLQVLPPKREGRRGPRPPPKYRQNLPEPRYKKMSPNQDWKAVWPAARVFHPAVVPLPIHMGYIERPELYSPPDKWANTELTKIPNFLHLTPPAIKLHCAAIKKFCTKWPDQLKTDEDCEKHFPMEYVYTDYVHAAPSIRNPRARKVMLQFKLDILPLDYHAKDKMIRMLNVKRDRYDPKTGIVTLDANRCPLKKQNYDYINYLLTAVFFESWKTEAWEAEKAQEDWERHYWEKSPSFKKVVQYLKEVSPEDVTDESQIMERSEVQMYKKAVGDLYDEGESPDTVNQYKESVVKLLNLKTK